jgi:hypothetical protein
VLAVMVEGYEELYLKSVSALCFDATNNVSILPYRGGCSYLGVSKLRSIAVIGQPDGHNRARDLKKTVLISVLCYFETQIQIEIQACHWTSPHRDIFTT